MSKLILGYSNRKEWQEMKDTEEERNRLNKAIVDEEDMEEYEMLLDRIQEE